MRKSGIVIYAMMGWGNYVEILQSLGKYKIAGISCLNIKKLEDVKMKVLEKTIKQSFSDMKKNILYT